MESINYEYNGQNEMETIFISQDPWEIIEEDYEVSPGKQWRHFWEGTKSREEV